MSWFRGLFMQTPTAYNQYLRVYQIATKCDSVEITYGGKIILPPSALETLIRLRIQYPMQFKLTNPRYPHLTTHAGVLEFTAEEGRCYLPEWLKEQLALVEGSDVVFITSAFLYPATFCKLQPFSDDFLQVTNPRVILEKALRNFSALSVGDQIPIKFGNKTYLVCVRELKPASAVSVVETDVSIEFDEPLSQTSALPRPSVSSTPPALPHPATTPSTTTATSPSTTTSASPSSNTTSTTEEVLETLHTEDTPTTNTTETSTPKFIPFSGSAVRLNGKPIGSTDNLRQSAPVAVGAYAGRGIPLRASADSYRNSKPLVFTGTARKLTGEVAYVAPTAQHPDQEEVKPEPDTESQPTPSFTPFSGAAYKLSD
ncbi:ubiquitin fusion degradation protein 1 [Pelomyxa schiedti]|nr:ubiquitin fusion degradation protein 1 [Pelomyxa schiedti]